ncbi:hypothetical protein JHK85_028201 [Glycine max]|nr:hypothetical protein JHK85_028201 [Glycine max]
MDESTNRHNDNLGVNKMGKNIRKTKRDQPNYGKNNNSNMNGGRQQQQHKQPQLYNITKNDFKDIVQQKKKKNLHLVVYHNRVFDHYVLVVIVYHTSSVVVKHTSSVIVVVDHSPSLLRVSFQLLFVNAIRDNTIDPIKDEVLDGLIENTQVEPISNISFRDDEDPLLYICIRVFLFGRNIDKGFEEKLKPEDSCLACQTHLASSSRLARRSPYSMKKLLREPKVR